MLAATAFNSASSALHRNAFEILSGRQPMTAARPTSRAPAVSASRASTRFDLLNGTARAARSKHADAPRQIAIEFWRDAAAGVTAAMTLATGRHAADAYAQRQLRTQPTAAGAAEGLNRPASDVRLAARLAPTAVPCAARDSRACGSPGAGAVEPSTLGARSLSRRGRLGTRQSRRSRRRRRRQPPKPAQIDRRHVQHRAELEPARIVSHERAGIRVEQCTRHLFARRAIFRSGEFARDVVERLPRLDRVLRPPPRSRRASKQPKHRSPAPAHRRDSPRRSTHATPSASNATRDDTRDEGTKDRRGRRVIEAPGTSNERKRKAKRSAAQKQKAPRKTRRFCVDYARRRRVVYFTCRAECAACGAAVRPRPTAADRRP